MSKTGTPVIRRSYHIPLPMFDEAFIRFQKKYVFPGNIVMTVLLLAIAGVYIHAALKEPDNTLVYLLIVACFAIVLVRWYRTLKLRRSVHEALKEIESDIYTLSVYEDRLVIHTEEEKQENAEEPEVLPAETEKEPAENAAGNGFQQICPEEPVQKDPIEDTEITFGPDVKIHDFPDYFMVYLVKRNFYLIPKKDFSADETEKLKKIFHI